MLQRAETLRPAHLHRHWGSGTARPVPGSHSPGSAVGILPGSLWECRAVSSSVASPAPTCMVKSGGWVPALLLLQMFPLRPFNQSVSSSGIFLSGPVPLPGDPPHQLCRHYPCLLSSLRFSNRKQCGPLVQISHSQANGGFIVFSSKLSGVSFTFVQIKGLFW